MASEATIQQLDEKFGNPQKSAEEVKQENETITKLQQQRLPWHNPYWKPNIQDFLYNLDDQEGIDDMKKFLLFMGEKNIPAISRNHFNWFKTLPPEQKGFFARPPDNADVIQNLGQLLSERIEILRVCHLLYLYIFFSLSFFTYPAQKQTKQLTK